MPVDQEWLLSDLVDLSDRPNRSDAPDRSGGPGSGENRRSCDATRTTAPAAEMTHPTSTSFP